MPNSNLRVCFSYVSAVRRACSNSKIPPDLRLMTPLGFFFYYFERKKEEKEKKKTQNLLIYTVNIDSN
jgi:hypothetical protein